MERSLRKPFQGVLNIIRFNWHFYVIAFLLIAFLLFFTTLLPTKFNLVSYLFIAAIISGTSLSLFASFYIYDVSNLYSLNWLNELQFKNEPLILNINAGFDETSQLLQRKY
ncbi:MAG: methyltransferase, partial [Pedobacter sp.]